MPAALIAAGATVVGGALTASATRKAANLASSAANANNALLKSQYDETAARLQPFVDRGAAADSRIAAFLGLGGDEAAAHQAFQDFLQSTGYQFQVDQGARAIAERKAAQGLLRSGSTLKALQTYGQNAARSSASQYLSQLGDVAGRGASAAGALGGAGASYAAQTAQTNTRAAETAGAASIAQAANLNSLLGSAPNAYGVFAGQSAYPRRTTAG